MAKIQVVVETTVVGTSSCHGNRNLIGSLLSHYCSTDSSQNLTYLSIQFGLPCGSAVKKSISSAGDAGATEYIPGSGRSPGEGNGNLLQYSYLGNPMNRGGWQATVHELEKELDVTQQLNNNSNIHLAYSVKIKLATYTA